MKFFTIVGLAAFAKAEFFGCPGHNPLYMGKETPTFAEF